jgi:low affinity Fe/Cu permease
MASDDPRDTTTPARRVTHDRSLFDHFADRATSVLSRGSSFAACALLIGAWSVLGFFVGFSGPWNNAFQSVAAVVTLLLVALLQNESARANQATQRKLNTLAAAMAAQVKDQDQPPADVVADLDAAIGLEQRESVA